MAMVVTGFNAGEISDRIAELEKGKASLNGSLAVCTIVGLGEAARLKAQMIAISGPLSDAQSALFTRLAEAEARLHAELIPNVSAHLPHLTTQIASARNALVLFRNEIANSPGIKRMAHGVVTIIFSYLERGEDSDSKKQ